MKDKIARRNDYNIAIHHHTSQSNILVLVDNPCDNISTSRTTVITKYNAYSKAQQSGSYYTSHKLLSRAKQLREISVTALNRT